MKPEISSSPFRLIGHTNTIIPVTYSNLDAPLLEGEWKHDSIPHSCRKRNANKRKTRRKNVEKRTETRIGTLQLSRDPLPTTKLVPYHAHPSPMHTLQHPHTRTNHTHPDQIQTPLKQTTPAIPLTSHTACLLASCRTSPPMSRGGVVSVYGRGVLVCVFLSLTFHFRLSGSAQRTGDWVPGQARVIDCGHWGKDGPCEKWVCGSGGGETSV
jgi:hypothetical protein